MANLGRMIVRGLGAAMTGLGTGIIQQAQVDERRRESQALMDREVALTRLRHGLNEETANNNVGRAVRTAAGTAQVGLAATRAELAIREPFVERRERAAEERDARNLQRQEGSAIRRLRAASEIELEQAAEMRAQGLGPSADVAMVGEDQEGNTVLIYDNGEQLVVPGVRQQPRPSSRSSESDGGIPRRGGGRSSGGGSGGGRGLMGAVAETAATTTARATQGTRNNPYTPRNAAERDALPAGSYYRAPDGQIYQKAG